VVGGDLHRIEQRASPGWSRVYARVLQEGTVAPGMPVAHLRAGPPSRGPSATRLE